MSNLVAAIAAISLLAIANVATAEPQFDGDAPRRLVNYADLDLSGPAGLEALNGRIRAAAAQLCGHQGRQSLAQDMAERRCFRTAIDKAHIAVQAAVARRSVRIAAQLDAEPSVR